MDRNRAARVPGDFDRVVEIGPAGTDCLGNTEVTKFYEHTSHRVRPECIAQCVGSRQSFPRKEGPPTFHTPFMMFPDFRTVLCRVSIDGMLPDPRTGMWPVPNNLLVNDTWESPSTLIGRRSRIPSFGGCISESAAGTIGVFSRFSQDGFSNRFPGW